MLHALLYTAQSTTTPTRKPRTTCTTRMQRSVYALNHGRRALFKHSFPHLPFVSALGSVFRQVTPIFYDRQRVYPVSTRSTDGPRSMPPNVFPVQTIAIHQRRQGKRVSTRCLSSFFGANLENPPPEPVNEGNAEHLGKEGSFIRLLVLPNSMSKTRGQTHSDSLLPL